MLLLGAPCLVLAQSEEESSESAETATDSEAARERRGFSERRSRNGFTERRPPFGGPTSPEGELEEADAERDPAFRFPAIDEALQAYMKRRKSELGNAEPLLEPTD